MVRKSGEESKKKGGRKPKKAQKEESGSENEEEIIEDDDKNVDKKDVKEEEIPAVKSTCTPRKIFVASKAIEDIGWENMEMMRIPHPKTGHNALFFMDKRDPKDFPELKGDNNFLFEIMTMEEETRSWFVDDSVVSDGNIYTCTPMDPLFFVLPALMKDSKAKPLADHLREIIHDDSFVKILTSRLIDSPQLEHISKKIVCDDIIAFKYLEENTLAWLTEKAEKVQKYLGVKDITGSEASVSSNFTKSSIVSNDDKKKEEYLRYGCEIIGEYLQEELKRQLFLKLGLPLVQEKTANKRKSEIEDGSDENQSKKVKVDGDGNINVQPVEDYGSATNTPMVPTNAKVKAKDKELQKAAKGTQSLFKFFTPKAK